MQAMEFSCCTLLSARPGLVRLPWSTPSPRVAPATAERAWRGHQKGIPGTGDANGIMTRLTATAATTTALCFVALESGQAIFAFFHEACELILEVQAAPALE